MEESATRWGSRDAVMVGTRLLTLVYLCLAVSDALLLDGAARVVLSAMGLATAATFAVAARLTLRVSDETVNLLLTLVCLLPLVNALARLSMTGRVVETSIVLLVVVGIGAVSATRRAGWGLVLLSCVAWAAVVLLTSPRPAADVDYFAVQLLLAALLSVAVLEIRLSAYRRLTRAIRRSDLDLRRFRSVFDDSPVGIGLADERGLYVEANPALCELLGRPAHEVRGHSGAEFTHPDDLESHANAGNLIHSAPDGVARVEKRYVRPGGEIRWAWLTFAHVAGPRGQTWTLAHMQDITARRKVEDELRLSRESMVAAVEIAQATQRGQDPRPTVLRHLKRLADASFVSIIEALDEDRLIVTAVDGEVDLVGLTMARDETSVTAQVWRTGKPVFSSELAPHPMVSRRLLAESGAASLMWQPVGVAGDMQAVLSIAWDDAFEGVATVGRTAVEAIAVEAGAALTGERMRSDLELSTVTDTLTGLLNRRGWDSDLERLRRHADRTGDTFTLALVDLDHFKRFNDTYGHLAGDEALRSFAACARESLRVVDLLARWGGEEFTVALEGTSGEHAISAIERLRACAPEGLTCSVGYVEVAPGDDLQVALARADAALYEAKETGRDRAVRGTLAAEGPLSQP